jgi:signal transduction histidine kinase/CheY-like chemotaxis protein
MAPAPHDLQLRFPLAWMALAAALTSCILLWQAWHVRESYRVGKEVASHFVRAEELRTVVLDLERHHSTCLRMAAATGESHWADQYRSAQTRFTEVIEAALERDFPADQKAEIRAIAKIHAAMQPLEARALSLASRGRREEALDLLASAGHRAREERFGGHVERFIAEVREDLAGRLREARNQELASLVPAGAAFVLSVLLWIAFIRRSGDWRRALVSAAARRSEAEAELREAQKMEALGQLAAGIAHDFNNLSTAISGYTDVARRSLPGGHKALAALAGVDRAVDQGTALTQALLTFTRREPIRRERLSLTRLAADQADLLRRTLPASIEVITQIEDGLDAWVDADPGQLSQALLNLGINARDAMPAGGRLTLSLRRSDAPDRSLGAAGDGRVELSVSDDGEGMSPAVRARIFEPFFTTKARGQGTGLGLPIVRGIVAANGGELELRSSPGRGSTFTIRLPLAREAADPPPGQAPAERGGALGTILLAEDHPYVREIMSATLESHGHRVIATGDGNEAMRLFEAQAPAIGLVILDLDLPGRSGLECLRALRRVDPKLPVILTTGLVTPDLEDRIGGKALLLRKPFAMDELARLAGVHIRVPPDGERPG